MSDALAQRLAAIVQSSDDAIVSKDLDGVIRSWNPAAERMFGYPADEAIGSPIALIVPDACLNEEAEVLSRIRHGESVEYYETVRRCRDGTLIPVSLTVSPIRGHDGTIMGASSITRDISDRRRVEATLAAAEARRNDLQRRLLALVGGSSALFASPQLCDMLPAVVVLAQSLIAADGYAIWQFDAVRGQWLIGASSRVSAEFVRDVVDDYATEPVGSVPFAEALAAEDVAAVAVLDSRRGAYAREGIQSVLAVPLTIRGQISGALVFYYRQRHQFDDVEVQTGRALANLAEAAITTALLYDAQQRSRDAAEHANQQATLLAEIGAALASSLDYETTLRAVVRLLVPRMADWSAVDIVDDGEFPIRRLAVAHIDSAGMETAERLGDQYPADPELPAGVRHVIRTGEAAMIAEVTPEVIRRMARDRRHHDVLASLPLASWLSVPLVAHGRVAGALTLVMAESGRHYTEADLRVAREVAYRAAFAVENARAYRQVNIANRAKDEFLATLSHELRTPLNAVLGWTQMLRAKTVVSEERMARALAVIEQNAEAQLRLIEDMLDVSRIIKGTFRLDVAPMSLTPVIEAAVETMRPAAEAKRIRLTVEVDEHADRIRGDAARLQQAVWNLLSNAIKFTQPGGRVDVSVRRDGAAVEVEVADTGEGIGPDALPYVFDRFRQGDSGMNRAHMGLGLGLAIVRHIVEMHGGQVQAASEGKGQGARLSLRLPALVEEATHGDAAHERHDTPSGGPAADPLAGLSVLVIDDDPAARELLTELLSTRGVRVREAATVSAGLEAIEGDLPDLILSDLAMPGEDGFDLIRRLRQRPPHRGGNLPAIAVSAYARPEDRSRSLASGFQLHLPKPLDPGALCSAVMALTRGARADEPRHGTAT